MPDRPPSNGRMAAPATPLNNRPVNRAALTVLRKLKANPDPSRLHLGTLLGEALELDSPGPGVPEPEWHNLRLQLAPLLVAGPTQALRWWTTNPNLTPEQQEADLTAMLLRAETPNQAMWSLLEVARDRLRA